MAQRSGTLYVKGYREFVRACDRSSKEVKSGLRKSLRAAGQLVRDEARRLLSRYDAESASKIGVSVRQSGVSVEQRHARVTGMRPDFGALQMTHALLPARNEKEPDLERAVEKMLDNLDF